MRMSQRFYDEEEAEAILGLAAQKSSTGGMSRECLLATAAEIGISAEAVEEAERTIQARKADQGLRAEYARHSRQELMGSLSSLMVGGAAVVGIDLYTTGRITWSGWILLFLGFAVVTNLAKVLFKTSSNSEAEFERWAEKKEEKRVIKEEGPAGLAAVWLKSHPGDRDGAVQHLRERLDMKKRDAKAVVDEVFLRF